MKQLFRVVAAFRVDPVPVLTHTADGDIVRYVAREFAPGETVSAADLGAFVLDLLTSECIEALPSGSVSRALEA